MCYVPTGFDALISIKLFTECSTNFILPVAEYDTITKLPENYFCRKPQKLFFGIEMVKKFSEVYKNPKDASKRIYTPQVFSGIKNTFSISPNIQPSLHVNKKVSFTDTR